MEEFFDIIYNAAVKNTTSVFDEFEVEDLLRIFTEERDPSTIKEFYIDLGKEIISKNGSGSEVKAICIRKGIKDKIANKIKAHWEANKVRIIGLMTKEVLDSTNRYKSLDYSIKNTFYTKEGEFKNQKKYATLKVVANTKDEGVEEQLVLDCKKENVMKIAGKMEEIRAKLAEFFEDSESEQ